MVVVDFTKHLETLRAEERAAEEARHMQARLRADLEWALADLIADLEAA